MRALLHLDTLGAVRTTVTLDDDVEAAIERLRRERGLGLSEALNLLARRGLTIREHRSPFRQRRVDLGLRVDVTDIGDVLDLLDD